MLKVITTDLHFHNSTQSQYDAENEIIIKSNRKLLPTPEK